MPADDADVHHRGLTHSGPRGAKMVDVTEKGETCRRAVAEGRLSLEPATLALIRDDEIAKGSVIETARLAGIMGAKRTAELIPLCHPLPLSSVQVDLELVDDPPSVVVTASATCVGRTGVEMEAMTAASVACLTVYDMCKAVDRAMSIEGVRLLEKSGGRSGHWLRPEAAGVPGRRGRVVALSVSEKKGEKKQNIDQAFFVKDHGLRGDAHAGPWHRQVSLLAQESIDTMRAAGLEVGAGEFAENVTTSGLRLVDLPLGTKVRLGVEVILEVTQIGKECHHHCAIFQQIGDCVMPREGIFARVLQPGVVRPGAEVEVL